MTPERLEKFERVASHRRFDLTVILENVHDPHNIAAVLRTCDAVGISEVYVIDNQIKFNTRLGKKSSSSANKWVDVHSFKNVDECLQVVKPKYQRILCTHLDSVAIELFQDDFSKGSLALVFGNEHDGVSNELLSRCDGNIFIPQIGMISSLNISVACAVALYEVFRQRQSSFVEGMTEQQEQLLNKWKSF